MEQKVNSRFMPIVTVVAVFAAIVVSFIGSGAAGGTPVSEAAGGALSADATPFAPDGPAFSIWSVIYLGLASYAVYQLLPAQRASARHAELRPWTALSAVLNAAWIGVVQADSIWGSVAVIVMLLVVLIRIMMILRKTRYTTRTDALFTDGTLGLYLGWVCVATTANIAAALSAAGLEKFTGWEWAAVAVLAVVVVIGLGLAVYTRGRIAPALAISWGLCWVAVGRISGEFASITLVWAAAIAAGIVLLGTTGLRVVAERQAAKSNW